MAQYMIFATLIAFSISASEYISDASKWGEFDPERWSAFYEWLNENNLLEEELDPDFGFTNDYLPE